MSARQDLAKTIESSYAVPEGMLKTAKSRLESSLLTGFELGKNIRGVFTVVAEAEACLQLWNDLNLRGLARMLKEPSITTDTFDRLRENLEQSISRLKEDALSRVLSMTTMGVSCSPHAVFDLLQLSYRIGQLSSGLPVQVVKGLEEVIAEELTEEEDD